MPKQEALFFKRLDRLCHLMVWLFRTGRDLRATDSNNAEEYNHAVVVLGKGALNALDIGLEIGVPPQGNVSGTLVVANHVSWLDIFAMSAIYPSSFIAKQEISGWSVLGKMDKSVGTVSISRDSHRDIEPINQAICAALKAGQNVSFFPEARTSSGLDILPSKVTPFQSAIDAEAPIQAVTLRYYDDDGQRTDLPPYAEVNLFQSLWRIVSMKKIHIRLGFSPQYKPTDMPDKDRYALKNIAEKSTGEIVTSDSPVRPLPKK